MDSDAVKEIPQGNFRVYQVPIISMAREKVGKAVVANIVALGIITELMGTVSAKSVESAILTRVPKGTEELNLKAFHLGLETGRSLKQSSKGK